MDTGTINKRPSVRIDQHETLHRGETVTFSATITDANDKLDTLTVEWRVGDSLENANASPPLPCAGEKKNECQYIVPERTESNSLYLVVQVRDRYSATSSDFRSFSIQNRAPKAKIELIQPAEPLLTYPLQTKFTFSGEGSEDHDPGDRESLVFKWEVKLNDQPFRAPDCSDANEPKLCSFIADPPGKYQVTLTVKDPSGASSNSASEPLTVDQDRPPCISFNPLSLNLMRFAGQENTFEVSRVADDVNPYPADPSKPGSTPGNFQWSIRSNTSGSFWRTSETANRYSVGPNVFSAGDEIQLRVEYRDREKRTSCNDEVTCCSLDRECCSGHSECECAQWITWTVKFQ